MKLPKLILQKPEERRNQIRNALIHREARIGGSLFGPVPKGHRREFFCLDRHTWVWHEEWKDTAGRQQVMTTRYEVRPNGVLKSQNGTYQPLPLDEARNLYRAIALYGQKVDQDYQRLLAA